MCRSAPHVRVYELITTAQISESVKGKQEPQANVDGIRRADKQEGGSGVGMIQLEREPLSYITQRDRGDLERSLGTRRPVRRPPPPASANRQGLRLPKASKWSAHALVRLGSRLEEKDGEEQARSSRATVSKNRSRDSRLAH